MLFSTILAAGLAQVMTVSAATMMVTVAANNKFQFTPNSVTAQPGDMVAFNFVAQVRTWNKLFTKQLLTGIRTTPSPHQPQTTLASPRTTQSSLISSLSPATPKLALTVEATAGTTIAKPATRLCSWYPSRILTPFTSIAPKPARHGYGYQPS